MHTLNLDTEIIINRYLFLTLGLGGSVDALSGSKLCPETPSFLRCVSVPEYCS